GLVEVLHGVVVVVPELLQPFLFGRQALVALGEDVPPRLVAAVAQMAPARLAGAAAERQAEHGADHHGDPLHRDSFHEVGPCRPGTTASAGLFRSTPTPAPRGSVRTKRCGLVMLTSLAFDTPRIVRPSPL